MAEQARWSEEFNEQGFTVRLNGLRRNFSFVHPTAIRLPNAIQVIRRAGYA
jgi:hypothetical protein